MRLSVCLFVAVSALTVGCGGPRLNSRVADARSFSATERCSQGPFHIDVPLDREARWGEGIEVVACGPRRIAGRYELHVEDHRIHSGSFGDIADNQRCVVDDVVPASPGAPSTNSHRASERASEDTQATARQTVRTRQAARLREIRIDPGECRYGIETQVVQVDIEYGAYMRLNRMGTEFSLRLWSTEPNDLEGIVFRARHTVLEPNVSEEEWLAHVEERERLDREADEQRWRRQEEEYDIFGRGERCNADPERDECRLAARETPEESLPEVVPMGAPPAPRAEDRSPRPSVHAEWVSGYWHWNAEWVWLSGRWRVPARDVTTGQTVHAPRAPPPPRRENRPMSPASAAIWCAGHWQWGGSAWVWVSGSWQLPPGGGYAWRVAAWQAAGGGAAFLPGGWVITVGH